LQAFRKVFVSFQTGSRLRESCQPGVDSTNSRGQEHEAVDALASDGAMNNDSSAMSFQWARPVARPRQQFPGKKAALARAPDFAEVDRE
jgi:hypothetical protein